MSQSTDNTLSDQSGANFRAELNTILAALGTWNSGSSEPTNPYQFMKWVDTSNSTYYYLKIRNVLNSAWTTIARYTVSTYLFEYTDDGNVLKDYFAPLASPSLTGTPTINGINISPYSGFKNLIINPKFKINQRGYISGTATTTSNQYCHDRWRAVTSGQSITFTETNGVVTVTCPSGGYEQIIENLNNLGGTFTLSFTGTATVSVAESSNNSTYTTVTANTDGSYTLTGGYYVRIRFSSGTVSMPQLEKGTVATPLEQRPYGLELSLCQRYCQDIGNTSLYGIIGEGTAISTTSAQITIPLKVPMRITPSIVNTLTNSNFEIETKPISLVTCTSIADNGSATSNLNVFYLLLGVASGLTSGYGVCFRNKNNSTNKILISAEL